MKLLAWLREQLRRAMALWRPDPPPPYVFERRHRAFVGMGKRPRRGKRLRAWCHRRGNLRRLVKAQRKVAA